MADTLYELSTKRSLNAKHFLLDDGQYKGEFHAGHIHYFNKLGLGDGEVRFREIDFTLQWDEVKRGWGFQFHNFHPFLPEYADQWIEFRDLFEDKDQTIRYKPVCSHVKGRLVQPQEIGIAKLTSVNCVIYDNAYGEGKDLILYFTRSTLAKVIRIRDGYKGTSDQIFDFEIDLPKQDNKELDIYRATNKEELEEELKTPIFNEKAQKYYKFDINRGKLFDTPKLTLIGNSKLDGKEWYTYLKSFKTWDSGELGNYHTQLIQAEYVLDYDKRILRKIVPTSFLKSSVGDVFTDTTTSYYSGAGDGWIQEGEVASWNTIHDNTGNSGGGAAVPATATIEVWSYGDGSGNIYITRGFVPVDTSGLPDSTTISAASLNVYVTTTMNGDNDGDDWINVIGDTSQASTDTLARADFNNCGAVDNPTEYASRIDITSSFTTNQYNAFTFNSTGIAAISKTGYTKLGVREGHDCIDSPINTNSHTGIKFNASEQTDTDKDPYLSVTYSTGSSASSSISLSPSATPSSSVSASPSSSYSSSQSGSPSISPSASQSPSSSVSPSPSISVSSSPSASPSSSQSPSSSVSSSPSASASASQSPSSSVSASPSLSPSVSVSASPSITPSLSISASPSITPSASISPSPSASTGSSASLSPSASPSVSVSASPSASQSVSISASPSVSVSSSPSISASVSVSASPSVSMSLSPSVSLSSSPSTSPSASVSLTPSSSISASPSNTPSASVSPSPSRTGSPSPSASYSLSPSGSVSASVSPSPSPAEYSDKYSNRNTTYQDKYRSW